MFVFLSNCIKCFIWLKSSDHFDQSAQIFVQLDWMFNFTNNQIGYFKLVVKKYTCHLYHKPLVEMDMFINKDKQGNQLK
jgi:hypothetical protein